VYCCCAVDAVLYLALEAFILSNNEHNEQKGTMCL
jgi:hypothetical protein